MEKATVDDLTKSGHKWQDEPADRVRSLLKCHLTFVVVITALSSMNSYARVSGAVEGDPVPHVWVVCVSVAQLATHVAAACKDDFAIAEQLSWHSMFLRLTASVFALLALVLPSSSVIDVVFGALVGQPLADFLVSSLDLYVSVELDVRIPGSMLAWVVQPLPFAFSLYRIRYLRSDHLSSLPMTIFTCQVCMLFAKMLFSIVKDNFMRMRASLKQEVLRSNESLIRVERFTADLQEVSLAQERLMKALFDIVVYLDENLCIQSPSGQLHEFLVPQCGSSAAVLQGRSLMDFVDAPADQDLIRFHLMPKTQGTDSDPGDEPGCQHGKGAAGAVCVGMRNASGGCSNVEIFYVRLAGTGRAGTVDGSSVLLGLRVGEAPPVEDEVEQQEDAGEAATMDQDATHECAGAGNSGPAALEARASHVSPDIEVNPSRLAVHFDASSDNFIIVGHNPLLGPVGDRTLRPQTLSAWLGADENKEEFEQWVVRSIQKAPWDVASTSEPYSAAVVLSVPRVRERDIHCANVWLEICPPDEVGDIEATLWVEGLTIERHGGRRNRGGRTGGTARRLLTPVLEEAASSDDDVDISVSSHSSGSTGCS